MHGGGYDPLIDHAWLENQSKMLVNPIDAIPLCGALVQGEQSQPT